METIKNDKCLKLWQQYVYCRKKEIKNCSQELLKFTICRSNELDMKYGYKLFKPNLDITNK